MAAVTVPPTPPILAVAPTGTNTLVLSWPYPSPGFILQQNSDLSSTNWMKVTDAGSVVAGYHHVPISPGPGIDFFRLIHP